MLTLMTVTLFVLDALDGGSGDSCVFGDSIAAKRAKVSLARSADFQGKRPKTIQA